MSVEGAIEAATVARENSEASLKDHVRKAQVEAHVARVRSEQVGDLDRAAQLRALADKLGALLVEAEAIGQVTNARKGA